MAKTLMLNLFVVIIMFLVAAVGLAWYFISHDRGSKEPIGILWLAFGLGFLGFVAAAMLEYFLIPASAFTAVGNGPTLPLLLSMLGVGAIEELVKFGPLAVFIYRRPYFNEHTDGIIYFALAGLGFGLTENIAYSLTMGASTGLLRALLVPFFHAATTGIVGFFLARGKLRHDKAYKVLPYLIAFMVIHGIYDFGLGSGMAVLALISIILTVLMTLGIFLYYMHAGELDQRMGLAAVGRNAFCRSCGQPNPDHNLYCKHCGKIA